MKPKKRKAKLDIILDAVADGVTSYDGLEDDIGECGFCHRLSYKDHADDCPVKLARELLGRTL